MSGSETDKITEVIPASRTLPKVSSILADPSLHPAYFMALSNVG